MNHKWLYLLLVSFLLLAICSACSFLYPLNIWDDSNIFFTVGKSIANGKVVYRDVYEQKGPLLFFIHSIGYLISNKSFIAIYFFEVISLFIFLIYSKKIIDLFCINDCYLLFPIIISIVFTSDIFSFGDSAEELVLSFLIIPFYFSIKNIYLDTTFTKGELIFIGFLLGCIFWIKYSLLGPAIGMLIIPSFVYLKKNKNKDYFRSILFIIIGFTIITIPILVYFALNNSLFDLFQVYFINNIFSYSSIEPRLNKVVSFFSSGMINIGKAISDNLLSSIMLFLSIFTIIINYHGLSRAHIILMFVTSCIPVFFLGTMYFYYPLILTLFIMFSSIPLTNLLHSFININKRYVIALILISSILMSLMMLDHKYLLLEDKDKLPQYKFANYMNQYGEDVSLLNYGFLDGGFYTTSNLVPEFKYFCKYNIMVDKIGNEQKSYISYGLPDFVVTCNNPLCSNNYSLAMISTYNYRIMKTYYLYINNSLLK